MFIAAVFDGIFFVLERLGSGSGGDSRRSSALGARSSAGRTRHQISLDGVDNKPYQVSNPQSIGKTECIHYLYFNSPI